MKNNILTSILLLMAVLFAGPAATAQTLDNARLAICDTPPFCQEAPICTYTDDCFKFDFYSPKDQGNGTSIIKYKITNYSESTFTQATFELPGASPAISPTNNFSNRYNHNVVNPFQDSLIAFNALNAGTFSYGGFEVYYFVVNNSELYSPAGRKAVVSAKAGRVWQQQRVGQVLVDYDLCEGPVTCPRPTAAISGPDSLCLFSDDPFVFTANVVAGATYNWTIENATIVSGQGTNTVEVMADVFPGPGSISVVIANNCGSVMSTMPFTVVEDCDLITPLPVELLSFKGVSTAEGVALNWVTASEKDNDRFEVQRSADGRSFETVGTVKGNGNSNTKLAYTFLDKRPVAGSNYYRLRQVDFDGTSEFTKVILVDARKKVENPVTLYPNPSTDGVFNVRMQSADQNVTLHVMDISGRVLHTRNVSSSNDVTIDGNALGMKPGIYLISVKAGEAVSIQKLMIK